MKTRVLTLIALLVTGLSLSATAKDGKGDKKEKTEVTFLVSMTCENCQKRIEDNIAFEKGVTDLDVDLPKKTVTIEYRKDKTTADKLKAALKKLGYTVTQLPSKKKQEKE